MTRRTKIVATLGPASESPDVLQALVDAGVDAVRVNLSHGSLDELAARVDAVRHAAAVCDHGGGRVGRPAPKVRCGAFGDDGVSLITGSQVTLMPGHGGSDEHRITVDYPALLDDLEAGDTEIVGDWADHAQRDGRRSGCCPRDGDHGWPRHGPSRLPHPQGAAPTGDADRPGRRAARDPCRWAAES